MKQDANKECREETVSEETVSEENKQEMRKRFVASVEKMKEALDASVRSVLEGGQAHIVLAIGEVTPDMMPEFLDDSPEWTSKHTNVVAGHGAAPLAMKTNSCARDLIEESSRRTIVSALKGIEGDPSAFRDLMSMLTDIGDNLDEAND